MEFLRNLFKSKEEKLLEKYGWKFLHYGSQKHLYEKIYYNSDFPDYIIQTYKLNHKCWRLLESMTHLPSEHSRLNDLWCTGKLDSEWLELINNSIKRVKLEENPSYR